MRRLPLAYVAGLTVILVVTVLFVLAVTQVVAIDSLVFWLYGNVLSFVVVLLLTALGGAFVGMIVAQRIFSSREFTPLERSLVEALASMKEMRDTLREVDDRLQRLEKR